MLQKCWENRKEKLEQPRRNSWGIREKYLADFIDCSKRNSQEFVVKTARKALIKKQANAKKKAERLMELTEELAQNLFEKGEDV